MYTVVYIVVHFGWFSRRGEQQVGGEHRAGVPSRETGSRGEHGFDLGRDSGK